MLNIDQNISKQILEIGKKLKAANFKLATAESCTGGLIGAVLTSVAGSSDWFSGGVIAYSNDIKNSILKVSGKTLEQFGAVSCETVKEMAIGVSELLNADISVSVSGIAGPGGGTSEKPVGLVFVGIYNRGQVESFKYCFEGSRDKVRELTTLEALNILLKTI